MKIIGTLKEIDFVKYLFANYCIDDCGRCFMNNNDGYGCGCEPTNIKFEIIEEEAKC